MGYRAVVVTVSDGVARGTRKDESGDAAERWLNDKGLEVTGRSVAPDDFHAITGELEELVDQEIELVVTTGGTGLAARDVTPEATAAVIARPAPGIPELMRTAGVAHTPLAALSRGLAGTAGKTLIINLPGSPAAVQESLEAIAEILQHALDLVAGKTDHTKGSGPGASQAPPGR